jgi:hypothetical protein
VQATLEMPCVSCPERAVENDKAVEAGIAASLGFGLLRSYALPLVRWNLAAFGLRS